MGIEVKKRDVNIYDLNEEGSIVLEKNKDSFTLEFQDFVIDINKEYQTTDLTVSQGNTQISFETPAQMEYFNTLIKELSNETTN